MINTVSIVSFKKVAVSCSDNSNSRKAKSHSYEERSLGKTKTKSSPNSYAQGPKFRGRRSEPETNSSNLQSTKPLDPKASDIKPGRSSHSSLAKGNKGCYLVSNSTVSQRALKLISNANLRMVVMEKLNDYLDKQNQYNGLIRLIADTDFLLYCYILIRGKTGKITPGSDKYTLDGLTLEWFQNVAKDILSGKFQFSPVRQVKITKAEKGKFRKLGVGSPREQIVQKALAILLEAIYEPQFLNCSYGFRPNRSTHGVLEQLYKQGNHFS